jgi:hypothetical protein
MGKALQLVSGYVTAPSAVFAAATPAGSDLFAVNDYQQGSSAYLINAWADIDQAGSLRMRSPNFHDDVNGVELVTAATTPIPLMDGYSKQLLQSNDTITYELADGGGGAPSGFTALHYYENLPGADAQLFRWTEIQNMIAELMTCRVAIGAVGGATAGNYRGQVAMTALQNLFKANGYYALLGYVSNVQYQSVGVTGTDTSNRRVGGPGTSPGVYDTREWFVKESNESGYPCIPVFKTQNLQSTVVDVVDTQAVGAGVIEFLFARLSGPIGSQV